MPVVLEYPESPHLVGDGLGISSPLEGHSHGCRASSESRTGNTEGVHGDLVRTIESLLVLSSIEVAGTNLCRTGSHYRLAGKSAATAHV